SRHRRAPPPSTPNTEKPSVREEANPHNTPPRPHRAPKPPPPAPPSPNTAQQHHRQPDRPEQQTQRAQRLECCQIHVLDRLIRLQPLNRRCRLESLVVQRRFQSRGGVLDRLAVGVDKKVPRSFLCWEVLAKRLIRQDQAALEDAVLQ